MASALARSAFVPRAPAPFRVQVRAGSRAPRRPARGGLQVVAQGNGRFIVGGNWKCNGDKASVAALIEGLNKGRGAARTRTTVHITRVMIDGLRMTSSNGTNGS